jgi:hypothetical protein
MAEKPPEVRREYSPLTPELSTPRPPWIVARSRFPAAEYPRALGIAFDPRMVCPERPAPPDTIDPQIPCWTAEIEKFPT